MGSLTSFALDYNPMAADYKLAVSDFTVQFSGRNLAEVDSKRLLVFFEVRISCANTIKVHGQTKGVFVFFARVQIGAIHRAI